MSFHRSQTKNMPQGNPAFTNTDGRKPPDYASGLSTQEADFDNAFRAAINIALGSNMPDSTAASETAAMIKENLTTTPVQVPAAQVPAAQVPAAQVPAAQVPAAQAPLAPVPVTQAPVTQAPDPQAPVVQAVPAQAATPEGTPAENAVRAMTASWAILDNPPSNGKWKSRMAKEKQSRQNQRRQRWAAEAIAEWKFTKACVDEILNP